MLMIDAQTLFTRTYQLCCQGKTYTAHLKIERRRQKVVFTANINESGSDVYQDAYDRPINFAPFIGFSSPDLERYVIEQGINVPESQNYQALKAELEQNEASLRKFHGRRLHQVNREQSRLASRKRQLQELAASAYAESALQLVGEHWLDSLPEQLGAFIQRDSHSVGVPFGLTNALRLAAIPRENRREIADSPGCYGWRKSRRLEPYQRNPT